MRRTTLSGVLLAGLIMSAALSAPLSALANPSAVTVPAPPSDQPIRIGLEWTLPGAEVGSTGGLLLIVDNQVLLDLPAGQAVSMQLAAGKIQVGGLPSPVGGPLRLTPKAPGYLTFKGKPYRGEMEALVTAGGRFALVNVVNLEDYLLAVVPHEMPSGWPIEALRAQAVASRTYTVTNLGKRKADGFDLRNNTDDQTYGGVRAETASTSQAVQTTRGQVITYQGRVVPAYYHASSGGHTENNEHVWAGGTPQGYLRGVVDYDNLPENAKYRWTFQFPAETFAAKLKQAGRNVGDVLEVIPGTPGASGRPITWSVKGSTGTATLTMLQMRSALGLPAPARSIAVQAESVPVAAHPAPQPEAEPVHVLSAGGETISRQVAGSHVVTAHGVSTLPSGPPAIALGVGTAAYVGRPVEPIPAPEPPPGPESKVVGFTVEGGGYGHGVGLSQWGAKGMAIQGKSYVEILTHFYTGVKVETR